MDSTSLDHIINLLVRKRDNFGNKHHKHTPNTMVYIVHWYKYAFYHSYKFELEYEINSLPSLFEYFERSKRKFRKTVISNFMNAIVTENWVVSFYPQVLQMLIASYLLFMHLQYCPLLATVRKIRKNAIFHLGVIQCEMAYVHQDKPFAMQSFS